MSSIASVNKSLIVVTGGTGASTGWNIARRLALSKSPKEVVITGRSRRRLDEALKEMRAPAGLVSSQVMDVTSYASCAEGFAKIQQRLGRIDHVIAAAGGTKAEKIDLTASSDSAPELWHLENDLKGALYTLHAAAPHLCASAQANSSDCLPPSIIFASSDAAYSNFSASPGYAMAKAALNSFVHSYADHLTPHGVRIGAVAFGYTLTSRTRQMPELNDYIAMEKVVDAFVDAITVGGLQRTGFVARIPQSHSKPFDVTGDVHEDRRASFFQRTSSKT